MQDIIGQRFTKWIVISYEGKRETSRHWYKVKCDCGNESIVERNILKRGKTTRCRSCARRISCSGIKNGAHTHGYSSPKHPYFNVYTAWCTMKSRCYREKDRNFKRYGAKGIKVCDRWLESFEHFLEDMGLPEKGNSLDRIDVYGNYEPQNCRWANKEVQSNNCRRNIYYEDTGIKLSESQWARKLEISRNKLMYWARKYGISWVITNIESLKKTHIGMSDREYIELGLKLPNKLYRHME